MHLAVKDKDLRRLLYFGRMIHESFYPSLVIEKSLHTGDDSGRSCQADSIHKWDFSFSSEPEKH